MNEFKIINDYFKILSKKNPAAKNLNDDVFFDKKNKLVVSIDTYNIGIHFNDFKYPYYVLKKIIRSSLSDIICKGATPKYYFLSGGGNKKTFTKKNLSLISKSLKEEQNKYSLKIGGGDTVYSEKISFSVTILGFSNKIVERNSAKKNDDIYVTGNIGDSYIGLKLIKKKTKIGNQLKKYFFKKYYCPDIPYNFSKKIINFANTSIDISDGLISDMQKLINKQNLSFNLYVDKIPISKQMLKYLNKKKENKLDSVFHGDDYQILFTSPKKNRKLIKSIANKMNQKVTIIGSIKDGNKKNLLLQGNKSLNLSKYRGYSHKF